MLKKLVVLFLIICCFGCDKNETGPDGCPAQMCTMEFAMIGVSFKDKNGDPVTIKDLTALNQRTKESVLATRIQEPLTPSGYYYITTDSQRKKFSDKGDDVLVTATHPNGQVKTATYKISGGCNCHVSRISGPQVITFD